MIRAVIFDFDGTMSNRQENAYGVFSAYFRPFFPKMNDAEYEALLQDMMLYDCNGTIPTEARLTQFMEKYGKDMPEGFVEDFASYYTYHMWEYTVLKEDTLEVLEKLKGRYKLGLLSNGDSLSQYAKIKAMDIMKYFDETIVSEDVGVGKPDPRIFEIMAEKLDVNCNECVMVGDVFSTDILGAINAGVTPVWILEDRERPAHFYKGYRIEKLHQLFDILNELEDKE